MKKLLLLGCFAVLGTINTFGQTTFGWETTPSGNADSKTETIDGITLTVTSPDGANLGIGSAGSMGGSGNSLQTYSSSTLFTFDSPVNITSMIVMSYYTENGLTFTLTPEGGDNPTVEATTSNHAATASLYWEGVTSFTVTSPVTLAMFDDLIVTTESLSTSEIAMEEIALYPNPTSSTLHIKGITGITSAEVFNSLGQLVLRNAASEINVEALSPRVYILKVTTDKGNFTKQFVKE